MTENNPYQNHGDAYVEPHRGVPSILMPLVVTGLVTALVFAIPAAIDHLVVDCCWNCVAGLGITLMGLLTGFLLASRSAHFGPGHGFAAAFLGVFGGAFAGILLQQLFPGDAETVTKQLKDFTNEVWRELERQQPRPEISKEELESGLKWTLQYGGIPFALVGSILAGFAGMLTVGLMNSPSRRRSRSVEHPPTDPANPWSGPQA